MTQKKELLLNHVDNMTAEQVELLYGVVFMLHDNNVCKGELMKLAYTKEQLNSIDSALPHDYVMRIQELIPTFKTWSHCYNYNEPNHHGCMDNVCEALIKRLESVFKWTS